ncbi:MAG: rhodanese-like domain-containing protein [Bernardetiaceae bacterium]|nr:rhodanese-like domain-containing protein [Bernardetiaceae bacterium]
MKTTIYILTILMLSVSTSLFGCSESKTQNQKNTMFFGLFGNKEKKYENLNAEEFAAQVANKNVEIWDVRTAGEFAGGHIKGAKLLELGSAAFNKAVENMSADKTYAVYCRSGMRSTQAVKKMTAQSEAKVYNLKGGISAWQSGGQPIKQ